MRTCFANWSAVVKRCALAGVLAGATVASAGPRFAFPVGHTATVTLDEQVGRVQVDNPALMSVRREGNRVKLVAKTDGTGLVTIHTPSGVHRITVKVTADEQSLPDTW